MRIYDGLYVNALEREIGYKLDTVKAGQTIDVTLADGLRHTVTIPSLNFPSDVLSIWQTMPDTDTEALNPADFTFYDWANNEEN